jgi:hypothetical protein
VERIEKNSGQAYKTQRSIRTEKLKPPASMLIQKGLD